MTGCYFTRFLLFFVSQYCIIMQIYNLKYFLQCFPIPAVFNRWLYVCVCGHAQIWIILSIDICLYFQSWILRRCRVKTGRGQWSATMGSVWCILLYCIYMITNNSNSSQKVTYSTVNTVLYCTVYNLVYMQLNIP